MNKKILYLIIVFLALVAAAGWTQPWNSTTSEAAVPLVNVERSDFTFDYQADAQLFNDHFNENLESESAMSIPDYPKDGKIFMEYFIQE